MIMIFPNKLFLIEKKISINSQSSILICLKKKPTLRQYSPVICKICTMTNHNHQKQINWSQFKHLP